MNKKAENNWLQENYKALILIVLFVIFGIVSFRWVNWRNIKLPEILVLDGDTDARMEYADKEESYIPTLNDEFGVEIKIDPKGKHLVGGDLIVSYAYNDLELKAVLARNGDFELLNHQVEQDLNASQINKLSVSFGVKPGVSSISNREAVVLLVFKRVSENETRIRFDEEGSVLVTEEENSNDLGSIMDFIVREVGEVEPTPTPDTSGYYVAVAENSGNVNLAIGESKVLNLTLMANSGVEITDLSDFRYNWSLNTLNQNAIIWVGDECEDNENCIIYPEIVGQNGGSAIAVVEVYKLSEQQVVASALFNITVRPAVVEENELTIKAKFSGINRQINQTISTHVSFVAASNLGQTAFEGNYEFSSDSEGVFSSPVIPFNFARDEVYFVRVTGEKHIMRNFMWRANSEILDITAHQLPAGNIRIGDTRDEDIDLNDLRELGAKMSVLPAGQGEDGYEEYMEALEVADLNYDGVVNNFDLGFILNQLRRSSPNDPIDVNVSN